MAEENRPARRVAAGKTVAGQIAVQVSDDLVKNYPDMLEDFLTWQSDGGTLGSHWALMRSAETLFRTSRHVAAVEGWCYMDDQPVAYLVRAVRRRVGRGFARYDVLGAARYSEALGDDPEQVTSVD